MDFNKMAVPFIVIISGLFSFFTGFLLGNIELLFLVIGFLPLLLSRVFLGKEFLEYIVPIYAGTVLLQGFLHLPVIAYPETYIQFFTWLLEIVLESRQAEVIIQNLDAAMTYKALFGSIIAFIAAYSYREGYFNRLRRLKS